MKIKYRISIFTAEWRRLFLQNERQGKTHGLTQFSCRAIGADCSEPNLRNKPIKSSRVAQPGPSSGFSITQTSEQEAASSTHVHFAAKFRQQPNKISNTVVFADFSYDERNWLRQRWWSWLSIQSIANRDPCRRRLMLDWTISELAPPIPIRRFLTPQLRSRDRGRQMEGNLVTANEWTNLEQGKLKLPNDWLSY